MKRTEGHIHVAMRSLLRAEQWELIAGEFPGGSDHELYPLNVVDPLVARDSSPDPRRHSTGELIPDIVALKGRALLLGEAKPNYNRGDEIKLRRLVQERQLDLYKALAKFAVERKFPQLLPLNNLVLYPTLIFFADSRKVPKPEPPFTHMLVDSPTSFRFLGALEQFPG